MFNNISGIHNSIAMRSQAEIKFARLLDSLSIPYQYEPFKFKRPNSQRIWYIPDFVFGPNYVIEVKSSHDRLGNTSIAKQVHKMSMLTFKYNYEFFLWNAQKCDAYTFLKIEPIYKIMSAYRLTVMGLERESAPLPYTVFERVGGTIPGYW